MKHERLHRAKSMYLLSKTLYLQEPETAEREFGNLLEIRDNYPKYVVPMDELNETSTYQGIQRLHVKDFCRMMAG